MRLTKKEIKRHFTNYLAVKWKFFGHGLPTDIQYEIAEFYQNGPDRKIIQGFRGVAKSYIVCSYAEWMWLNDVNYRFIILSGNAAKANEISTFVKNCIENFPLLHPICPPNINKAIWGNERLFIHGADTMMAPSLKSVGIKGNFTGSRAHEIIADDIEIPSNSATPDMRDKLFKRSTEMESVILPEIGRITMLGTPQTEETIYKRYEDRGYACRRWPSRVPEERMLTAYGNSLSPKIKKMIDEGRYWEPVEPTRFNDFTLMQREVGMGRSEFMLQFMLDTSLSDAEKYPLKLRDLIVMSVDTDKAPISLAWGATPDTQVKELTNVGFSGDRYHRPIFVDKTWAPYEHKLMTIDPSGRGKDETGYCIMNQLHGKLFVADFGGLSGGYERPALEALASIARNHRVNKILIEDNFGDGMFSELFKAVLRETYPCSVEDLKVTGQKEKRIISWLEPVMNQHRIVVDIGALQRDIKRVVDSNKEGDCWYSLLYQLSRITKDRGSLKHDDVLDALAIGCNYYSQSMARVGDEERQRFHEREKDKQFKEFMRGAMVFSQPGSTRVPDKKPQVFNDPLRRRRRPY